MPSFEISDVDSFTTGTVGPKGQRTFYLQAKAGSSVVSLKLEKQQVMAMAEYLAEILVDAPEITALDWTTAPDLVEPVEPLWIVGAMGAAYDPETDAVIVMAEEAAESEDDEDVSVATFRLARAQTVAFVERARELVEAGRPPCAFCARPLNFGEDGFCPCWN
jgi:uncharacterized repeat protein (TIGR03847 family)